MKTLKTKKYSINENNHIYNRKSCLTAILTITFFATILVGCGSKASPNISSESTEQSDSDESKKKEKLTDSFTMNKETQKGFLQPNEPVTEIPNEYIGIYAVEDMSKLEENKKGKYILMTDLDFTDSSWKTTDFEGILEGNYHTISGLSTCLFDEFKGKVQNLGLENINGTTAALVKCMEKGTISNCYATGQMNGHGGLVCLIYPSYGASIEIRNSYNSADLVNTERDQAHSHYVTSTGGIVGEIDLNDNSKDSVKIVLSNCANYGNISAERKAGGIVGEIHRSVTGRGYYMEAEADCKISRCFNYGRIEGKNSVGGILGEITATNASKSIKNNFTISQCANYSELNVSGDHAQAGGICADIDLQTNQGYNSVLVVEIADCLNTAAINIMNENNTANEGGGVCGEIALTYGTCKINRCLNIGNTNEEYRSKPTINNATPIYECNDYYTTRDLSIGKMKNMKENLPNFDYPDVWGISKLYDGFPHPYGLDEYEEIQATYKAKSQEQTDTMLKDSKKSEIILRQRYTDLLADMSLAGYWPEDESKENLCSYLQEYSTDGSSKSNYFAFADINQDGQEELLINSSQDGVRIYSYDLKKKKVKKEDSKDTLEKFEKDYEHLPKLSWASLKAENYRIYTEAYIRYYSNMLEKDMSFDIALLLMKNDGNATKLTEPLSSEYGISFSEDDEGLSYEGTYEGKQIISIITEESSSIQYQNERIDGMTLLGIYPGMEESKAITQLEKYGFMKKDDNCYITGGSFGNYFIYYHIENGKITQISIMQGNLYVG